MSDNLLTIYQYFIILENIKEFNITSYNSNNMVWRSLPGTEIPDYEESAKGVFCIFFVVRNFFVYKCKISFQEVKHELFSIAKN